MYAYIFIIYKLYRQLEDTVIEADGLVVAVNIPAIPLGAELINTFKRTNALLCVEIF